MQPTRTYACAWIYEARGLRHRLNFEIARHARHASLLFSEYAANSRIYRDSRVPRSGAAHRAEFVLLSPEINCGPTVVRGSRSSDRSKIIVWECKCRFVVNSTLSEWIKAWISAVLTMRILWRTALFLETFTFFEGFVVWYLKKGFRRFVILRVYNIHRVSNQRRSYNLVYFIF